MHMTNVMMIEHLSLNINIPKHTPITESLLFDWACKLSLTAKMLLLLSVDVLTTDIN